MQAGSAFGVDAAAAEDEFKRVREAFCTPVIGEQARQALGAAIARQQAQADFGLAEAGGGFGDAVVAGERELHPATECDALDRGDAGFAHLLDPVEGELGVVGKDAGFGLVVDIFQHLADVGAGDKAGGAFAGEDDGDDIVLASEMLGDDHQFVDGAFVERVDGGVGDGDGGNPFSGGYLIVLDQEIAVAIEQLLFIGQALAALPTVDHALQFGETFGVAERAGVAEVGAFDERPDHAADIFARAGFGELADLEEVGRDRDGALFGADEIGEAALVLVGEAAACSRGDEGDRGEALFAVRGTDDENIADRRIGIERLVAQDCALDLLGAHAVARYVYHIVGAAVQREAAIGVPDCEIALGVGGCTRPALPIAPGPAVVIAAPGRVHLAVGDGEVCGVAPDGAGKIGIGRLDDDFALFARLGGAVAGGRVRVLDPHVSQHPGQRPCVGVGAKRIVGVAVEMGEGDAAMFGRPVAVGIPGDDMRHPEGLDRRRGGLGAEGCAAQRAEVVALDVLQVFGVGHN